MWHVEAIVWLSDPQACHFSTHTSQLYETVYCCMLQTLVTRLQILPIRDVLTIMGYNNILCSFLKEKCYYEVRIFTLINTLHNSVIIFHTIGS
jgi:hypothetical protein